MASISVVQSLSDSFFVRLVGLDTNYNQTIRLASYSARIGSTVYSSNSESIPNQVSSTNGVWLNGLAQGTTYTIRCVISNITGSSNVTLETSGTTATIVYDPPLPNAPSGLNVSNITTTTAYATWNSLQYATGYEYNYTGIWYYTSGTSHNLSGLSPGSGYTFRVRGVNHGNTSPEATYYFVTSSNRPSNWEWTYAKISGQPVFNTNGKIVSILPATEWNNFTARINQFRNYKGVGTYTFTTVTNTTNFTAAIANQAVNAINGMGKGIPTVSSGSTITAAFFNNLRDQLNSIT